MPDRISRRDAPLDFTSAVASNHAHAATADDAANDMRADMRAGRERLGAAPSSHPQASEKQVIITRREAAVTSRNGSPSSPHADAR